jgi:hypothetical protein
LWSTPRVALLRGRRPGRWWWRRSYRAELLQDAAQHLDAGRQRISIGLDSLSQQIEECELLFVVQIEPHGLLERSAVEVIGSPIEHGRELQ